MTVVPTDPAGAAARAADAGHEVALRIALARVAAGLPVDPATLPARSRRAVALADRLGAPRGPALAATADAARARHDLERAIEVAAAEGRSVARALVLLPPVLGPLVAVLVTDDPLAVWGTTAGRAVLAVAVLLWALGGLAVRLLVRRATRPATGADGPSEELLELVAVALAAGVGLASALRRAGRALGGADRTAAVALWLELGTHGPPPAGWGTVGPVLAEAHRDGMPLVGLARSLAAARRQEDHHAAMQRAARLGALLTVPTTLLLLPAAGLVVAAPVLHGALAALT